MENIGKAVLAICINLRKPNFFLGSPKKYKNPFSLPVKMCQMTSQKWFPNSGRDLKWLFQVTGKIKIVRFKPHNLEPFSRYCSTNFQFEQTQQCPLDKINS